MNSNFKAQVKIIEIPDDIKSLCKKYADGLDQNRHFGRKVGRWDDLYRSCIGQEMVHYYLDSLNIGHEYMKPYHSEGRPLNEFDIKISDETYDVKTRSRWNETYCHNIELIMSEHEREEKHKVDFYIFATIDETLKNIYLLGAKEYFSLWNNLHDPKEFWDNAKTKKREYLFQPAGYILSRELEPLKKIIFRV